MISDQDKFGLLMYAIGAATASFFIIFIPKMLSGRGLDFKSDGYSIVESDKKRALINLNDGNITVYKITDANFSIKQDSITLYSAIPYFNLLTFAHDMPEAKTQVEKFLKTYGGDIKSGTVQELKSAFGIDVISTDPQSFAVPRRRGDVALLHATRQNQRA